MRERKKERDMERKRRGSKKSTQDKKDEGRKEIQKEKTFQKQKGNCNENATAIWSERIEGKVNNSKEKRNSLLTSLQQKFRVYGVDLRRNHKGMLKIAKSHKLEAIIYRL